jgi:preprotein translocase subunit SecA
MKKNLLRRNSITRKYQNLVNQINSFEDQFQTLTDNELRVQSFKLKKRYQQSQNLDLLISESFALTREASLRTLGLRHFDVQLIGGIVLNNQKIAEMKTGEGKTLVATLSASLNALTEKGVHVITINDYLASRDHASMGQIYSLLGLSTGLIQDNMSKFDRKKNYNTDITYVTNYEVTFDFLRDNMALNSNDVVLRPFNYCIVDEVDSVLIDEAQTPLILSDQLETSSDKYMIAAEITNYLQPKIHYTIDEKNKNVILTDMGSQQIEKILQIQDLYDLRNPWIPYVMNAIKAYALFFKNVHYIIQNDRIVIVDEFTGRIMPDRRWGDGLHQAIEAKEKLPIRKKSETQAEITYQNFFLLYPKLSGMTGTGKTAEIEFEKIYKLSVDEIPTARPTLRRDLSDLIYKDQFLKWNAIAKTCNKISSTGQPILIGTTTIGKSEMLAALLNEYKLSYQLLNAKPENVRRESEIVAQAGKKGSITIATNMAGRGTDIILGGNITFNVQKELYDILTFSRNYMLTKNISIFNSPLKNKLECNSQRFLSVLFSILCDPLFLKLSDIEILRALKENDKISIPNISYQCAIQFLIDELKMYYNKHQKQENQIVKNLGGLYIIGTERNDSRRVDNQLRGRCGRQGDPGTSQFFLSLEDNLLRLFGGSRVQTLLQSTMVDDLPLESNLLTRSLNSAQQKVEERAYQQRKNLFDYDEVLNKQRRGIYSDRIRILNKESLRRTIIGYGEQVITNNLLLMQTEKISSKEISSVFEDFFGKSFVINSENPLIFQQYLFNEFWLLYQAKRNELAIYGDGICDALERTICLVNIDQIWREHLQEMPLLREAVGWRGYGQQNPLYEYKKDALKFFSKRIRNLSQLVIYDFLRSSVS